jgi:hypothetical protein
MASIPSVLNGYIRSISLRENELLRQLREETASIGGAFLQITPEQGQLLSIFVRASNSSKNIRTWSVYWLQFSGDSAIVAAPRQAHCL